MRMTIENVKNIVDLILLSDIDKTFRIESEIENKKFTIDFRGDNVFFTCGKFVYCGKVNKNNTSCLWSRERA